MIVIIIDGYLYKNIEINNKIFQFLMHMHKSIGIKKLFEISTFYKKVSILQSWAYSKHIDFMNLEYKNIINQNTNTNLLIYDLSIDYACKWKKKSKYSIDVCFLILNKNSLPNIKYLTNKAFDSKINIFCI